MESSPPSPQQPSTSSSSLPPPPVAAPEREWSLDDKLRLAMAVYFNLEETGGYEKDWDSISTSISKSLQEEKEMNKKKKKNKNANDNLDFDIDMFSKDNCILQYQKLEVSIGATSEIDKDNIDPLDVSENILTMLSQEKRTVLLNNLLQGKNNRSDTIKKNKKVEKGPEEPSSEIVTTLNNIKVKEKTPDQCRVRVEESPKIDSSVLSLPIADSTTKTTVVPSEFLDKEIKPKTNEGGNNEQNVNEQKRFTRARAICKIVPMATPKDYYSLVSPIQQTEDQSESSVMLQQDVKMPIGTGNKSDVEVKNKGKSEGIKRISNSASSSLRTPTHRVLTPTPDSNRVGVITSSVFEALPPSLVFKVLDFNPISPSTTATVFDLSNIENELEEHKVFKKKCISCLGHIIALKNASIFLEPITDESVKGYTQCIKKPMDLSTIKKFIENGKIRKLVDFERYLNLMFLNSLLFNSSNMLIRKMTNEMMFETRKIIENFKLRLNECQQQQEKEINISELSLSKTPQASEAEAESKDGKLGRGRPKKADLRKHLGNQTVKRNDRLSPDIIKADLQAIQKLPSFD